MQRHAARAGLKPSRPRPQWGNWRAALPAVAASASPQDGAGTFRSEATLSGLAPCAPTLSGLAPCAPEPIIRLLPGPL